VLTYHFSEEVKDFLRLFRQSHVVLFLKKKFQLNFTAGIFIALL